MTTPGSACVNEILGTSTPKSRMSVLIEPATSIPLAVRWACRVVITDLVMPGFDRPHPPSVDPDRARVHEDECAMGRDVCVAEHRDGEWDVHRPGRPAHPQPRLLAAAARTDTLILVGAYLATLVTTYLPARSASRVAPAEALRYE